MKTGRFNFLQKFITGSMMFIMPAISHSPLSAQLASDDDKTLSPYFFIPVERPGDVPSGQVVLESTSADVKITGVIANVTIRQSYKNEGNTAVEAIYVFPASTRAAVYKMKMTIGERVINAGIAERNKARQAYEDARENGQSASLLEQERPNVFTMNVANIMPGDVIMVEMSYTELMVPETGIYEFVYPTVVGPRYASQSEDLVASAERWIKNPYSDEAAPPLYSFDFRARISAGMPIREISCSTHETVIIYEGPASANITLKDGAGYSGNRDVIIRYQLAGNSIETGLLLFEGEDENFFLAMVQPPVKHIPDMIPPKEYVFIVDVSGSMHGFPLDVSKEMMKKLLLGLTSVDRFNILLFSGGSSLFSETSLEATTSNIESALNFLASQHGWGGTELLPALKRAMALPTEENFARSFVILTDGYVSVEHEAFDYIRGNLGHANFFTFGIGSSVNRYIIEGMAHAGSGADFVVTRPENAEVTAERFRNYISNPLLTKIEVRYLDFEVYDVEPLSPADVFAERPL
ncbi:MAG TPA: VIT domain-containing protein, partial [Bacteroidales bacterium]|nr:VIT domain-containing protein [Bacteroidales bacterium]